MRSIRVLNSKSPGLCGSQVENSSDTQGVGTLEYSSLIHHSGYRAAAQRSVKIDDGAEPSALKLYLLKLGVEQVALGIEDFQIA